MATGGLEPLGDFYCWACDRWQNIESVETLSLDEIVETLRAMRGCSVCGGRLAAQIHGPMDRRLFALLGEGHRDKVNRLIQPILRLISDVLDAIPEGKWIDG